MATLERVMQMKQQGIPESQIIPLLRKEGISPKEINDALSQSKIKSELNSNTPEIGYENYPPEQNYESNYSPQNNFPIQPPYPIQEFPEQEQTREDFQSQSPHYQNEEEEYPPKNYSPEEYSQEPYQNYPEYQSPQSADIETMNDIAEQIVEEKTSPIKKQISEFKQFKEEIKSEIKDLNKRLQKIENAFGNLQAAILGKIGEQSKSLQDLTKEMQLTQDSFSKIINPLTDNIRALKKISGEDNKELEKKETKGRKNKSKDDFENYLR